MRHLHRPRLSLRARKTVGTILDLTVRGLETGKDTIAAVAPVPGLSVALDVLIEVLKKVQVICLRATGCITNVEQRFLPGCKRQQQVFAIADRRN